MPQIPAQSVTRRLFQRQLAGGCCVIQDTPLYMMATVIPQTRMAHIIVTSRDNFPCVLCKKFQGFMWGNDDEKNQSILQRSQQEG